MEEAPDDAARVATAAELFGALLPEPPADVALLRTLVAAAMTNRSMMTVEALPALAGHAPTVESRWAMTSAVRSLSAEARAWLTSRSLCASRLLASSSRTITGASATIARAGAVRCFWVLGDQSRRRNGGVAVCALQLGALEGFDRLRAPIEVLRHL